MTTLKFPFVLVPLVALVFPVIAMASLFLHVQKNKIVYSRWHKISSIFFQN